MKDVKLVGAPLGSHFKLRRDELSATEMEEMKNVPYAFVVGNLLYVMMYTRPDITYVVKAVNKHLINSGKEY